MPFTLPTNLFHYSEHPIPRIVKRVYTGRFWAVLDLNKPLGFWFAVEYPEDPDDCGWYQLCTVFKEGIMVRRVRYKYSVRLKEDAVILLIENEAQLQQFVKTHGYQEKRHSEHPFSEIHKKKAESQKTWEAMFPDGVHFFNDIDYMYDIKIDWLTIYRNYQGITIAPYLWQFRSAWMWYNAWDCASGCIWDLSTIESIELVEKRQIRKIKGTQLYKMKELN